MPKEITFKELFEDDYLSKILSSTEQFKSIGEISSECDVPIASCYRRIDMLKKFNLVDATAVIIKGAKFFKYRRNKAYFYQKHNIKAREILDAINKKPGISMAELVKITGYSYSTLHNQILNLIKFESIILKKNNRKTHLFSKYASQNRVNSITN